MKMPLNTPANLRRITSGSGIPAAFARAVMAARGAAFSGMCMALLCACSVGPDYKRPQPEVPSSWSQTGRQATAQVKQEAMAVKEEWWRIFDDDDLSSLVATALSANQDLHAARARVRQARAAATVVGATVLPAANASASAARLRASEHGTLAGLEDIPSGIGLGDIPLPGEEIDLFQAGFDASWEIDVFGGRKREIESAKAQIQAASYRAAGAATSLCAEVARNYFELRALQARIISLEHSISAQAEILELTRQRQQAGTLSALEVAQASSLLERTRAELPLLQEQAGARINRLAVLSGRFPNELAAELSDYHQLPAPPALIAMGLPSQLLERRPDVQAAERELAAATALIGAATAELFPRFSLSAALGLQSQRLPDLARTGSRAWSFAPAAMWPLFDAGRARAHIGEASARNEQALMSFEKSVLQAFADVENAATAHRKAMERAAALANSVQAERETAQLTEQRQHAGLTDFVNVLRTRQSLYAAEDRLAAARGQSLVSAVALYKALGGGWKTPSSQ